jgi:dolichyl-phosphate beta-glucosyltransferase
MVKVSIVIPSYRSAKVLENNLPYLLLFLQEQNFASEVIIVDDGSKDSGETERVAIHHKCSYLTYPENRGKGFAVRTGMAAAQGEICIFTDADIPFETSAIEAIIHYIQVKEFDVVIGDRGLQASNYFSKISNQRRFGSGFFTFIVGRFVTTGISDTQCGLKGFRKNVAIDLFGKSRIHGFTFDVELVYISLKRNYDIKKIPVNLRSQEGNSVNIFKHGFKMVLDLFILKINHLRGYYNGNE